MVGSAYLVTKSIWAIQTAFADVDGRRTSRKSRPGKDGLFYLWTYVKELFPNDVETPQQKLSVKKTILTC